MTDPLRALHADADRRLTAVATLAYELGAGQAVQQTWAKADGLLSRLVAVALEDLAGRAFPSPADGPHVSGASTSSQTETAGLIGLHVTELDVDVETTAGRRQWVRRKLAAAYRPGDYEKVARAVQHVIGILEHAPTVAPDDDLARASVRQGLAKALSHTATVLERCAQRITPRATGEPCPTVATDADGIIIARCQGKVTHHSTGRGLCEQCDADWRPRRGLQIPADVIDARNRRRRHPCTCHDDACDHAPGACLGLLAPGELTGRCETCACSCGPDCCPDGCADPRAAGRTVSDRCDKRIKRKRAKERSTTGTDGAFGWNTPT